MEQTISVIVPIYKVEKYLRQCLDSIVNQTYKDLEIILVDDGSPDNCGAICDEYAKRDDRIVVIHKANGGLSAARNDGIAWATGEWVTFVDSDDWCELDYYEKILASTTEKMPDVIIAGGHYIEYPKQHKEIHSFDNTKFCDVQECIEDLKARIVTYGLPWDKLYRASFLKENELFFDTGIRAFEDVLFNFQVFDKSKKVSLVPVVGYHYRQVAVSIANGFNPDKPEINYAFVSKLHKYAETHGASKKVMNGINTAAICAISVAMNCCYFHPGNPEKHSVVRKEFVEMKRWPHYHEAIWSRSNCFMSKKQKVLQCALRLPCVFPVKWLYLGNRCLKTIM